MWFDAWFWSFSAIVLIEMKSSDRDIVLRLMGYGSGLLKRRALIKSHIICLTFTEHVEKFEQTWYLITLYS